MKVCRKLHVIHQNSVRDLKRIRTNVSGFARDQSIGMRLLSGSDS